MNYLKIIIPCLIGLGMVQAQSSEHKWGLGISGGTNQYSGDLGNRVFAFDQAGYGFGGVSLAYYLNPSLNLIGQGTYGAYGYSNPYQSFVGSKIDFDLMLHFRMNNGWILPKNFRLEPFLLAGMGTAGYRGTKIIPVTHEGYKVNDITIPVGGGIKYHLKPFLAIQYQFIYKFTDHDVRDRHIVTDKSDGRQDHYGQQAISLIFQIGRLRKDGDNDGVPDKKDLCPYTPPGIPVDSVGCPFDRDGDSVYDYADLCPDIPGMRSASGCPDQDEDGVADDQDLCPDEFGRNGSKGCPDDDGDGVINSEDACPDKAGLKKHKGCPDTDGDGIPDHEDDCPYKAGSAEMKGCPDTDADGVPDYLDECPGIPGTINGCPDRDGDGVPDHKDLCPDRAGTHQKKGCPEISTEALDLLSQALNGVQFESGKSVIKSQSFSILDKIARLMEKYPEYILLLDGHTDSQGDPEKNQELSESRAEAVKEYLENKKVLPERIQARGYGDTRPVGNNDTPEGRALNRRVEFKMEIE